MLFDRSLPKAHRYQHNQYSFLTEAFPVVFAIKPHKMKSFFYQTSSIIHWSLLLNIFSTIFILSIFDSISKINFIWSRTLSKIMIVSNLKIFRYGPKTLCHFIVSQLPPGKALSPFIPDYCACTSLLCRKPQTSDLWQNRKQSRGLV